MSQNLQGGRVQGASYNKIWKIWPRIDPISTSDLLLSDISIFLTNWHSILNILWLTKNKQKHFRHWRKNYPLILRWLSGTSLWTIHLKKAETYLQHITTRNSPLSAQPWFIWTYQGSERSKVLSSSVIILNTPTRRCIVWTMSSTIIWIPSLKIGKLTTFGVMGLQAWHPSNSWIWFSHVLSCPIHYTGWSGLKNSSHSRENIHGPISVYI